MNAIIALCHFCDLHGPKTLFCTQAFKFIEIKNENLSGSSKSFSSNSSNSSIGSNITCKACRAFEKTFVHYISYDSTSQICYISQSTPSDSEVFTLVRKACLRTLHCEVFEDPIYFDDDKNGSVIGYEFHVKDSEGRGFQRSYSLLIIMKDRMYLQHLWSFLQNEMSIVATRIKTAAQKVYDLEVKENPHPTLHHISTNVNMFKKSPNKSNRGLIELTNDTLIFAKLHMWFTWILRASACQITELFLHGPTIEDALVKFEQTKNENDMCEQNNKKNVSFDLTDGSFRKFASEEFHFKFDSFKDLIRVIGHESFHLLAFNVIVGNQVIIKCKYQSVLKSILQLLEQLIPYGCRKTVYYSKVYINSYQSNLLGLDEDADLQDPNNQILNDYILLNLQVLSSELEFISLIDFSNCTFKVDVKTNKIIKQEDIPEILTKIEKFIFNNSLDSNSINQLINWNREEWLNKAKVFYKYAKTPASNKNHDIKTFLQSLKLDKKDELALRFWQTGLSNDCKSLIRAT